MALNNKHKTAACSIPLIIGIMMSQHNDKLKVDADGLHLIGGFESCQQNSYYCPAHRVTAGVGHTGADVEINKTYSNEQIAQWWTSDILDAQRCVTNNINTNIGQHQLNAYVSFTFNIGCGNFKKSKVLRLANEGKFDLSCAALLDYDKAKVNGEYIKLAGLTRRRVAENAECLKPN